MQMPRAMACRSTAATRSSCASSTCGWMTKRRSNGEGALRPILVEEHLALSVLREVFPSFRTELAQRAQ